jgi:hypothetical protein
MNVANVDDVDLECRWYPTYRSADRGNREAAAKIRTATHAGLFSRRKMPSMILTLVRRLTAPWQFSFDFKLQ